jgi:HlyD family secretion protein
MIKILAYIVAGFILIAGTFIVMSPHTKRGPCVMPRFLTISDVTLGGFVESIPASGEMKDKSVAAKIDEFYVRRIQVGLHAISDHADLIVTNVDSTIVEGRFSIELKFKDNQQIPADGQRVRFRIYLSNPTQATLVPVGGFYKDTGGQWILVVNDSMHVVKRHIRLGRKNPDYIEVLSGLMPGEKVITSSYENYTGFDFRKPVTIEDLKDISYHFKK